MSLLQLVPKKTKVLKLKIFKFTNKWNNYSGGDYFFIAMNLEQAQVMADSYAREHNEKYNHGAERLIEWTRNVHFYEVKPGLLPIGFENES